MDGLLRNDADDGSLELYSTAPDGPISYAPCETYDDLVAVDKSGSPEFVMFGGTVSRTFSADAMRGDDGISTPMFFMYMDGDKGHEVAVADMAERVGLTLRLTDDAMPKVGDEVSVRGLDTALNLAMGEPLVYFVGFD